jgi:hypothetical protein
MRGRAPSPSGGRAEGVVARRANLRGWLEPRDGRTGEVDIAEFPFRMWAAVAGRSPIASRWLSRAPRRRDLRTTRGFAAPPRSGCAISWAAPLAPAAVRGLGNGRRQHGTRSSTQRVPSQNTPSVPFGYPGASARDASTSTGWQGAVGMRQVVACATSSPGEGPSAAQDAVGIGHVAWQRPTRPPTVPVVRRASPPGREGRPLCESSDTPTSTPRTRRVSRIGRTWTAQPRLMDWCPSITRPFALGGRVEARGAVDGAALDPRDPAPRIADRPAALAPEAGAAASLGSPLPR